MTQPTTTSLAAAVHDATAQARTALGALDPGDFAAPSSLPGWRNAQLLAHLDGVSRALARQLAYAARGERIGFYDGGVEGRNERIDLGALQQPAALAAQVRQGLDLLDEAITDIPAGGWEAATSFRGDGTVT